LITISLIQLNNLTLIRLPCWMWTLHCCQRKLSEEMSTEGGLLSGLRSNCCIHNVLVGEYVSILGTVNTLFLYM